MHSNRIFHLIHNLLVLLYKLWRHNIAIWVVLNHLNSGLTASQAIGPWPRWLGLQTLSFGPPHSSWLWRATPPKFAMQLPPPFWYIVHICDWNPRLELKWYTHTSNPQNALILAPSNETWSQVGRIYSPTRCNALAQSCITLPLACQLLDIWIEYPFLDWNCTKTPKTTSI